MSGHPRSKWPKNKRPGGRATAKKFKHSAFGFSFSHRDIERREGFIRADKAKGKA